MSRRTESNKQDYQLNLYMWHRYVTVCIVTWIANIFAFQRGVVLFPHLTFELWKENTVIVIYTQFIFWREKLATAAKMFVHSQREYSLNDWEQNTLLLQKHLVWCFSARHPRIWQGIWESQGTETLDKIKKNKKNISFFFPWYLIRNSREMLSYAECFEQRGGRVLSRSCSKHYTWNNGNLSNRDAS